MEVTKILDEECSLLDVSYIDRILPAQFARPILFSPISCVPSSRLTSLIPQQVNISVARTDPEGEILVPWGRLQVECDARDNQIQLSAGAAFMSMMEIVLNFITYSAH
jgi:hypothetical protein